MRCNIGALGFGLHTSFLTLSPLVKNVSATLCYVHTDILNEGPYKYFFFLSNWLIINYTVVNS